MLFMHCVRRGVSGPLPAEYYAFLGNWDKAFVVIHVLSSFLQGADLLTWSNLTSNVPAADEQGASGIINMEDDDDDFSDHETNSHATTAADTSFLNFTPTSPSKGLVEGSKPFEILRDLLCHHAHLAVFMNYVISNSDPSALVKHNFLLLLSALLTNSF